MYACVIEPHWAANRQPTRETINLPISQPQAANLQSERPTKHVREDEGWETRNGCGRSLPAHIRRASSPKNELGI